MLYARILGLYWTLVWTGMFHVLDWCGLVCFMYWTGVMCCLYTWAYTAFRNRGVKFGYSNNIQCTCIIHFFVGGGGGGGGGGRGSFEPIDPLLHMPMSTAGP